MKNIIRLLSVLVLVFTGCAQQQIAMKADTSYFTPARVTTKAKALQQKGVAVTSLTTAQKRINENATVIELLRKENKELRERIQRLEKKLQIQNS